MTLAQRLNELAVANSEGLLNDDEYRLLRHNLFERFASNTSVPTEASVVPLTGHALFVNNVSSSRSTQMAPSNNFHADSTRSPSIKSKASISSGVTNLLRRVSGRKSAFASNDRPSNDTASIVSSSSRGSSIFQRTIFPRRQALRRLDTPPSSFPAQIMGETKHITPGNTHNVFDDDNLKTVKDIRKEIWAVETEGRRLMDAFNGLELTNITRDQLRPPPPVMPIIQPVGGRDGVGSTWTLIPEGRSYHHGPDSDTVSIRSGTSIGTTPSMTRSGFSGRRVWIKPGTLLASSQPTSLRRKNSVSSVSSQGHSTSPPVPALPLYLGVLGIDSGSNVSLPRSNSHLTSSAFQKGDGMAPSMRANNNTTAAGMVDIRRRRAEVMERYEARLEYLRAKLRGAELHEKLLRQ